MTRSFIGRRRKFMFAPFLLVLILPTMMYKCDYSDGSRSGVITKFSRKGILCKTYEGTLSIGFMKNGQGTVSKEDWAFSAGDTSITRQIEGFAGRGTPVKITYSEKYFVLPCGGDTHYFVTKVEAIQ